MSYIRENEGDNDQIYENNEFLTSFLSFKDLFHQISRLVCCTKKDDRNMLEFFSRVEQEIFDIFGDDYIDSYDKDEFQEILINFIEKLTEACKAYFLEGNDNLNSVRIMKDSAIIKYISVNISQKLPEIFYDLKLREINRIIT